MSGEMNELATAINNTNMDNLSRGFDAEVIVYVNNDFYKDLIRDGMNGPSKYDKEQCIPFMGCPFFVVDNDSHPSYVVSSRLRV